MRCLLRYQSGVFYSRSINIYFSSYFNIQCIIDSQKLYQLLFFNMLALNGNKPIWVRDNEHGFILGRISDIGSDNVTVQLNDSRKV